MVPEGWLAGVRRQAGPTLVLAFPVAVAELGWMLMSTVDTIMVGRLGAEAIGAVGVGGMVFWVVLVFGMGLLLGLDTVVSQAFGAGRVDETRDWLIHGVCLALAITLPLMVLIQGAGPLLRSWGIHSDVVRLAEPYLGIVSWSLLPLVLYQVARRYLIATGRAVPVMASLLTANIVNLVANWVLVFGNLGAPTLGVDGAAWAACTTRGYMALTVLSYVAYAEGPALWTKLRAGFSLRWARFRRLLDLGLPAAVQLTLEVAVIATMTALAGRLDPVSLAAHQIALSSASLSFMSTLGIAAAGAVRVGQALGRRDPPAAVDASWAAFGLAGVVMACAGLAFLMAPEQIVRVFTNDEATILAGASLLLIAAAFQLFDGLQAVAIGVLRGAGDTRTPMVWTLAAHWLLGLPIGTVLCFGLGWGVRGLWIGLSVALIAIACALLAVWVKRVRAFLSPSEPYAVPVSG